MAVLEHVRGTTETSMHTDRFFIALAIVATSSFGFTTQSTRAADVFKCVGGKGQVAFQDHACAANERGDRVAVAAAPAFVPSPIYGVAKSSRTDRHAGSKRVSSRGAAGVRDVQSYECRAGNGDVFYRHSACPKSIRVAASGRRGEKSNAYEVRSIAMPRREACQRMQREVGRSGRSRDDSVSTYERNEGRDACRAY